MENKILEKRLRYPRALDMLPSRIT